MAMKIDRIQPAGMNVRLQQGKPAYSHVVAVTGPGKTIYIAGQLARDAEGNIVGPGDMRAQLEQTFKNLDAYLKAAGATWADVVKTNTFVTNYQAFSQCSDVRMRYFGVAGPTSTLRLIVGRRVGVLHDDQPVSDIWAGLKAAQPIVDPVSQVLTRN